MRQRRAAHAQAVISAERARVAQALAGCPPSVLPVQPDAIVLNMDDLARARVALLNQSTAAQMASAKAEQASRYLDARKPAILSAMRATVRRGKSAVKAAIVRVSEAQAVQSAASAMAAQVWADALSLRRGAGAAVARPAMREALRRLRVERQAQSSLQAAHSNRQQWEQFTEAAKQRLSFVTQEKE
jgi:hypothetical protein